VSLKFDLLLCSSERRPRSSSSASFIFDRARVSLDDRTVGIAIGASVGERAVH
jgi:hypothetical protein